VYTLQYSSTRAEVWRWYWRAWAAPNGLWRVHALAVVAIAAVLWPLGLSPVHQPWRFFEIAGVLVVVALAFMILWPQLRFKSKSRVLKVDANGWSTQIGDLSGSRSCKDVLAVEDGDGAIVLVSANGSAIIVPNRAFADDTARGEFLCAVRRWHEEAKRGAVPSA
jgi:hypothetical protein